MTGTGKHSRAHVKSESPEHAAIKKFLINATFAPVDRTNEGSPVAAASTSLPARMSADHVAAMVHQYLPLENHGFHIDYDGEERRLSISSLGEAQAMQHNLEANTPPRRKHHQSRSVDEAQR